MKSKAFAFAVFLLLTAAIAPHFVFQKQAWIYDDKALAQLHQYVMQRDFGAIWSTPYWAGLKEAFQQENLYRPMFLSVFSILQAHPAWIRSLVVFSHLGVGLLVFWLLRRLLMTQAKRPEKESSWIALAGAAFFILHPMQVEVLSQAVGMMETVPAFLGLLALCVLPKSPALALGLASLAPGWKETGFIWLGSVVLLLVAQRRWIHAVSGAVVVVGWLALRTWVYGNPFSFAATPFYLLNPLVNMDAWDGWLSRLTLIGQYLRLYLMPITLSSDYSLGTLPLPGYLIQVWVMLGVGALVWLGKRALVLREKIFTWENAVVWIPMLTLLPVLHLVTPLAMIFSERFGYSFSIAMTLFVWPMFPKLSRTLALAAVILVLGLFYGRGLQRHSDWVSAERLFAHDLKVFPQNAKLHLNYATVLGTRGDWEGARFELSQAIKLVPDFPEAHYRLGVVNRKLGSEQQAQEHWRAADQLGYPVPRE